MASIRSATWNATPSSVARARSATEVARVSPKIAPRAAGSQYGAPRPVKRGHEDELVFAIRRQGKLR